MGKEALVVCAFSMYLTYTAVFKSLYEQFELHAVLAVGSCDLLLDLNSFQGLDFSGVEIQTW